MAKEIKILSSFLEQLNQAAHEKSAELQVEDSGSKIARIQGYLAGVRAYKQVLQRAGIEIPSAVLSGDSKRDPWVATEKHEGSKIEVSTLALTELREVCREISDAKESEFFGAIQANKREVVEKMKDRLFYECDKGRDLFLCKGWCDAIMQVEKWIERLEAVLESKEAEAANSLDFGD